MAQYKVTLTIKTETKQPRRGERESLRDRLLKLVNHHGETLASPTLLPEQLPSFVQATRRSLKVRRER